MSEKTTSWILELVNKISQPAKEIVKSSSAITNAVEEITDAVKFNEKETRESLTQSKQHYKDLESQIKNVEKELKDLDKVKSKGDWAEAMEASKAFDNAKEKLERLRTALKGADEDVKDLTESVKKFDDNAENWTNVVTGINQGVELIQKATDGLDFSINVANLTTEVQRMTDLTSDALDEFVRKSRNIASVYDQDAEKIARATNAMTKQNGLSYEENFKLIEDGFKRGANSNGDFIDQLLEYQPFIKQLGMTQAQAIAMIAKSGKDGIYSDKAIDALKEANLALREMGKTQVDALAGIGMTPEDLIGKTPFDAIQLISQQMKGASSQARQLILTDIFKGAGEDAGIKWAEELGTADFDLANLPSVEQAGAGMKGFFSDLSTWAGQTFGNIGIYATQMSPMIQGIAGMIPIMQMLSKVTFVQTTIQKIATAGQWAWNAALSANPIGVIIVLIGALIAAIAWVASSTTGWGEAWNHTINAAKFIFLGFVSGIKANFNLMINGLMIGINKIKEGWYSFKDAVGLGDSSENQRMLEQIRSDTEARKESIKKGYTEAADYGIKAAIEMSKAVDAVKWKEDKEQAKNNTPSVNEYVTGSTELLGGVAPTDKSKKEKKGDGLNVGSGSNGIKSITMTLNIENNFNVNKGTDIRAIADQITGHINDRLRDSVINLAG